MGTKPTHTHIPKEFHSISLMEKRLRGELTTIIRMKQRREQKINNLKKSIDSLKTELNQLDIRLKEFSQKIEESVDSEFPKFDLYHQKGKKDSEDRFRIHYTIQRRREKIELGNYNTINEKMKELYPQFGDKETSLLKKDEIILKEYQNEIRMKYWEREYKRWVEGGFSTSKK